MQLYNQIIVDQIITDSDTPKTVLSNVWAVKQGVAVHSWPTRTLVVTVSCVGAADHHKLLHDAHQLAPTCALMAVLVPSLVGT